MDQVLRCTRADLAATYADRAWHDGLLIEESGDFPNPLWSLVAVAAAGSPRTALDRARDALDFATRRGSRQPAEWYTIVAGIAHHMLGDVGAAEATVLTWIEQVGEPQSPVALPALVTAFVGVHRERGRLDEAYAVLRRWSSLGSELGGDWGAADLHNARGLLHLAAGRAVDALADFERCAAVLSSFDASRSALPAWRCGAAASLLALGRADEARTVAEEQLADARRWGAAPLTGQSLRTLALVAGGAEGITLAEEAVDVLAHSEAAGEHARALLTLGRLLRLDRRPTAAREHLAQALEMAERSGAVLLADETEAELRLAGAAAAS
jgi:tetratricopeptide (TPR) repeat protein